MLPQRVGLLGRFSLKKGIDFAHFGLEPGMVFEGTTGVHKRISHFNSNEQESKIICEFEMDFNKRK